MVRATRKANTNEKKEYIRNYASESGGKTPTGQCRNVGLPRRKPINTNSNGTSSPNYSFVSPSLVRVGLPRLNKTPNSNSRLHFKSPLITTPTAIECPALIENVKGNTPVRTSDRSRVKKKLQEDFNHADETPEKESITNTPISTDKTEIINAPLLETSSETSSKNNESKKKQKAQKEVLKTDSKQSAKTRKRKAEPEDKNNISDESTITSEESMPKTSCPKSTNLNEISPTCPILEPQASSSGDMCPMDSLMKKKVMYSNTQSNVQLGIKSPECPKLEPQVISVNRTKKLILSESSKIKSNNLSSFNSTDEEDSIPLASIIKKRIVVPEKHTIKHRLSLKKSNNSVNSIETNTNDNSGKTNAQTMQRTEINISEKERTENNLKSEIQKLQEDVKAKVVKLESLKRTKVSKENVQELNKLTNTWEVGCRNALVALHKKINQLGRKITMEGLLSNFQIPEGRFKFDV